MTKRLLNKTTSEFLIFSILVLIVAAPLFYLITNKLYIIEIDETLQTHKKEFIRDHQNLLKEDITYCNKYNRNVKILPSKGITKDTIFSTTYYDQAENEKEPYREIQAPVSIKGTEYTYVERTNLVEMEDIIMSIALMFLLLSAVLLTGILWISKISSGRKWEPFYDTLSQIRDFEIDKNKRPQFAATNITEFETLNKSIDRLIEKNTAIYKNQREFIENAAHELQTPLALFQNKLDLLMQFPNISMEQSDILKLLDDDIARLNRLNKNLLLLSKIENTTALDKKKVVLNDSIMKHLEFFSEQAKAKNLNIITEFRDIVSIDTNPALVEVLLNNLFLNAIRHNNKDGKIIILIEKFSITFLNSGPIIALDHEKLFNRFAKLNPSGNGNGLGLAIVKKIAELNYWEVSYSFQKHLHGFTVKFTESKKNT